jgi:hypothetical protein
VQIFRLVSAPAGPVAATASSAAAAAGKAILQGAVMMNTSQTEITRQNRDSGIERRRKEDFRTLCNWALTHTVTQSSRKKEGYDDKKVKV